MGVQFKLAQKKDIKSLVDLINECFNEETAHPFAQKIFNQTERDPNQLHLIGINDENKLVAYCKITIIPCIFSPTETYAILDHVCVKPDFRREHIGTHLLEVAEATAKEHGAHSFVLWSKNSCKAAHALYKKIGFEIFDGPIFEKEFN